MTPPRATYPTTDPAEQARIRATRRGLATAARHAHIDPKAVERAVAGDRPKFLTRAEKQAATAILTTRGLSRPQIAAVLRCGTAAVGRYRRDLHATTNPNPNLNPATTTSEPGSTRAPARAADPTTPPHERNGTMPDKRVPAPGATPIFGTRTRLLPQAIIGYRGDGRPIRAIAGGAPARAGDLPPDADALAAHLATLSADQLAELEAELVAAFDAGYGEDGAGVDADGLASLARISEQITAVRGAATAMGEAAAAQAAQITQLRESVHAGDAPADGEPVEGEIVDSEVPAGLEAVAASFAAALVAALGNATGTAPSAAAQARAAARTGVRPSLGAIACHAPAAALPARPGLVLTASSDIPGLPMGTELRDIRALADAVSARARMLPITHGTGQRVPVASLHRNFRFTLGMDATPEQVLEVLTAAADLDALTAAGGWCAPSEISYDFFNIVAEDGMLDVPSVGVMNRGGFRWPTSPTFDDIVSASPDGFWTWTETDDISAVTGAPTKDCVRVPCPEFNEERLVCDGLCVTAGNLIDYAYPENVANFLRLVLAARAHLTNTRINGLLDSNSTGVTMAGPSGGFTGDLMNAIELQATDYRNRYAMADDAVLKVDLPQWVDGPLRSDWARRTGIEDSTLMDAMLGEMFAARDVQVQYTQDWQVRTSGQPGDPAGFLTDWPGTVQFRVYAPGTFVRGQGLRLDLGVVRDSVLNETNDFTAAWMEDCYLIAPVGHESRLVTTNICVAGTTGAAEISCT